MSEGGDRGSDDLLPGQSAQDRDPAGEGRSGPAGASSPPCASPERRRFLAAVTLGSGALLGGALIAPWTAMFLTPLRTDREVWRGIGAPEDFPVGSTRLVTYLDAAPLPWAGYAARSAAWVRRESRDAFTAFAAHCTHVGCAVRWEEGARLFLCPCHGGAFHADGRVAAGPPPRPLDRYPIRIREGRVEIQALGIPDPSE